MLSDVREQAEGVRFLQRVVDQHFTSPLLLVGMEGVGRRFSVVQAAKEMFCSGTHQTGCTCYNCVQMDLGVHPDFSLFVPETGKDIGVEVVRALVAFADTCPTMASTRVLVVDGVDRMTGAAATALLKVLEEPPPMVRFFLLAESKTRVLPTIQSRCGVVSYTALSDSLLLSILSKFEPDEAKARVIARLSEGSVGRAVYYWGSGRILLRDKAVVLLQLAVKRDVATLFSVVDSVEKELPQVLLFLTQLLHDILLVATIPTRLINLDLILELTRLSQKVPARRWLDILISIRELQARFGQTKVQLPFHLKTLFARAFEV